MFDLFQRFIYSCFAVIALAVAGCSALWRPFPTKLAALAQSGRSSSRRQMADALSTTQPPFILAPPCSSRATLKCYTMKATSRLGFKGWPKIHHPLPQTPRESQELLSALTSSFRRQLDAADAHQPAQSANEHMQSILQNPLFRVVPPKPSFSALGVPHEKVQLEKRIAENPLAVFDDLAAAGALNSSAIANCLNAQLGLITKGPEPNDVREKMKKTGAGTKVTEWFWASDSAARVSFFRLQRTTKVALKFMVAEGLHDEIYQFIRILSRLDVGGDKGKIPKEAGYRMYRVFLRDYVNAEIHYGRGLAAALQTFNLICAMMEYSKRDILAKAVMCISRFILEHKESEQLKSVPASVFDDFCKNLSAMHNILFWRHAIRIYHPSHPDARPFLGHAREMHLIWSSREDTQQDIIIQVCLDALRLSIEQKKYKDARQLSTYIEKMLSGERSETLNHSDHSPQLSELMGRLNLAVG